MSPYEHHPDAPTPTGQQWLIGHGRQQAYITEVGATLRTYTVDDQPVIDGFGIDEWSHSGRGQVLAPWPNRLGDGRYEFGGQAAEAALNEPALGNAIHGLVRWLPWHVQAHAQNVVVLGCDLYPTPGYPFSLRLRIEYRLGREGLSVTTAAINRGPTALPFGLGFHPYLTVGSDWIDTVGLHVPAHDWLELDGRSLPTGEVRSVAGTELDFTGSRPIGSTRMDTAFTGLAREADGLAWIQLENPENGRMVELWMDDQFGYLMCYTGDTMGDPGRRRRSLAVEPMTCPPDAFRSQRDVVVLEPGQQWEGVWGLRAR